MRTHPVLTQLAESGVRLGLQATKDFLRTLDEPHLAYPVVHVAGTNGKGSVCAYVTEALVAAGYRVGTNTSPHLDQVNERIRIDGVPIDDAYLSEGIEALDRARRAWARRRGLEGPPLTYFEFVTTLAFKLFAMRGVDVAVVEVGLGGRLDATNVVQPVVCGITSIGLDHIDRLGTDLASIATEKAGILKPGVPCVVGPLASEAMASVRRRARITGSELWVPGEHLQRERRGGEWVLSTPLGTVGPIRLGMRGAHQGANAAVALGILHRLRVAGFAVDDEAITTGLSRAQIPGRLERIRSGLVVDGAHNPDGAAALASWLGEQPRPNTRILLFGMGEERDPRAVLGPILPHVDEVVLTRCAHPKARSVQQLADALGHVTVTLSDGGSIEQCLAEVYAEADETIVAGSLYLVGAARALVADGELDGLQPGAGLPLP